MVKINTPKEKPAIQVISIAKKWLEVETCNEYDELFRCLAFHAAGEHDIILRTTADGDWFILGDSFYESNNPKNPEFKDLFAKCKA